MTVKREEPQESRATPIKQRLTTGYADFFLFSSFCARTRDHTHGVHAFVHENTAKTLNYAHAVRKLTSSHFAS